jgi:hypothetical protein
MVENIGACHSNMHGTSSISAQGEVLANDQVCVVDPGPVEGIAVYVAE